MKVKKALLELTQNLPYFSRSDLRVLPFPEKSVEVALYRATKKEEIVRLRRGLYVATSYVRKTQLTQTHTDYLEFVANILVQPSYVTAEYILAKHELLTEAVTTVTSYTTRRPNLVSNELGYYRYRNISTKLLGSFETVKRGGFLIKRASKIQALIDYLYFKKKEMSELSVSAVAELRLNLHLLTKREIKDLKANATLLKSKKLNQLISLVEEVHAAK